VFVEELSQIPAISSVAAALTSKHNPIRVATKWQIGSSIAFVMQHESSVKSGALFVDFENVFYALVNDPFRLHRDDALAVAIEAVQGVRQHFRDDGFALIVERSYADWDQIPENAQRQLQISGVLPRYADSRANKNTADIELSLDVLQHILTQPESQHVVLIGGDRDYLPILRRVKECYRHIWVCSLRRCLSGDVREFVSNYAQAQIVELDDFVRKSDTSRRHQSYPVTPLDPAGDHSPGTNFQESDSGTAASNDEAEIRTSTTTRLVGDGEDSHQAPRQARPAIAMTGGKGLWDGDPDNVEGPELYLSTMLRFISERGYTEIRLGPYFRWLLAEGVFESSSTSEQRTFLNQLVTDGAIRVEERDGTPFPYSVAVVNWNHAVVRRLNTGTSEGRK